MMKSLNVSVADISDPERILEGEVVYSDYKYCDINSDPSHETGKFERSIR